MTTLCNHPGLSAVNGCPKELAICCESCKMESCENRCGCISACEHKVVAEEVKEVPEEPKKSWAYAIGAEIADGLCGYHSIYD